MQVENRKKNHKQKTIQFKPTKQTKNHQGCVKYFSSACHCSSFLAGWGSRRQQWKSIVSLLCLVKIYLIRTEPYSPCGSNFATLKFSCHHDFVFAK